MNPILPCKDSCLGNYGDDIRVMQMDNIGWEPFETPTIPKIGNGSMGKQ
jgi:hypothetical protein